LNEVSGLIPDLEAKGYRPLIQTFAFPAMNTKNKAGLPFHAMTPMFNQVDFTLRCSDQETDSLSVLQSLAHKKLPISMSSGAWNDLCYKTSIPVISTTKELHTFLMSVLQWGATKEGRVLINEKLNEALEVAQESYTPGYVASAWLRFIA
jgi:hypothetical protein